MPTISERILHRESKKGVDLLWALFPRDLHTFQYLKPGGTNSVVRTFTDAGKAWASALQHNQKGYDIYWMVNEGDGVVHQGKNTCRSQASVRHLSATFIDTDDCPIETIDAYLSEIGIEAHLVVESSPNRYHYYFLIADSPLAREENISQWQAIQHMLHRLGNPNISPKEIGTDGTMHDYSKVLRVPGFTHVAKIHTVKVVEQSSHDAYTLEDLYALCEGSLWDTREEEPEYQQPKGSQAVDYSIPEEPLASGERFATLQKISLSLANDVKAGHLEEGDARDTFAHFVEHGLDNSDGVYYDNDLTEKSWALWRSALGKVRNEEATQVKVLSQSLEKEPESPWNLPDEFYTSAPGGFGQVVKEVMARSLFPCAALSFGAFLAGLSILKAMKMLTPQKSSPALYILNVAPSGFGKNAPMQLLQNMLSDNGLKYLYTNEIRSDRGIYEYIKRNNGPVLFLLDEVAQLLKAIQKEDAQSHHANITKALLHLFSQGNTKGVKFGQVGAQKGKSQAELVVDRPRIGFCGCAVTGQFKAMFNADSVSNGLFQRFIPIVPQVVKVPKNPDCCSLPDLKSDLFVPYFRDLPQPPSELPKKDGEENEEDCDAPVPELTEPVITCARYSTKALKFFDQLQDEYRDKLIEYSQKGEDVMSGLYSRLAEQIERVATVLSPGEEIELKTLEYAATFIESRHKATLAVCGSSLIRGDGSKGMEKEERLIKALCKAAQESGEAFIGKREIYASCRRTFKDMREFDSALDSLIQMGKIELDTRKDRKRHSRPQTMLRLVVEL